MSLLLTRCPFAQAHEWKSCWEWGWLPLPHPHVSLYRVCAGRGVTAPLPASWAQPGKQSGAGQELLAWAPKAAALHRVLGSLSAPRPLLQSQRDSMQRLRAAGRGRSFRVLLHCCVAFQGHPAQGHHSAQCRISLLKKNLSMLYFVTVRV